MKTLRGLSLLALLPLVTAHADDEKPTATTPVAAGAPYRDPFAQSFPIRQEHHPKN